MGDDTMLDRVAITGNVLHRITPTQDNPVTLVDWRSKYNVIYTEKCAETFRNQIWPHHFNMLVLML